MEEIKRKVCTRCQQEKVTSDFYKNSFTKDHLCLYCKDCSKEKDKESQKRRREKFLRENDGSQVTKKICRRCNQEKEISNFCKLTLSPDHFHYYCRECQAILLKEHRESNHEKCLQDAANWRRSNVAMRTKYSTAYKKKQRETDTAYRIKADLRSRLGSALKKQNATKLDRTVILLGCSIQEFKQHLESQFQPGMTWENRSEWHIDHIKPCAAFDLTKDEDQRVCFHHKNMQPMWASENIKKSSFYKGKKYINGDETQH